MMIVYTKNNCPFCDRVKKYLDAKGIQYEVWNIEEDPQALYDLQQWGVMGVPVVLTDDKQMIVGYDEEKLSKL